MPKIPILAKGSEKSGKDRTQCTTNAALARPLPAFYMADYSVLGFLVDRLEEAIRVLQGARYAVVNENGDFEVVVDHAGHIEVILQLLTANAVASEFADVVSGIYQG
jgi:hypothetical protein